MENISNQTCKSSVPYLKLLTTAQIQDICSFQDPGGSTFFPIPLGQKSLKPIKSFTVIWAPYFLKTGDLEFKGKVWSYLFFIWLWWLHQIRFIYKENNAINVLAAQVFMKTSQILLRSPIKCNSVNLSEPNPYLRTCNAPKLNLWSWWKGFRSFFCVWKGHRDSVLSNPQSLSAWQGAHMPLARAVPAFTSARNFLLLARSLASHSWRGSKEKQTHCPDTGKRDACEGLVPKLCEPPAMSKCWGPWCPWLTPSARCSMSSVGPEDILLGYPDVWTSPINTKKSGGSLRSPEFWWPHEVSHGKTLVLLKRERGEKEHKN